MERNSNETVVDGTVTSIGMRSYLHLVYQQQKIMAYIHEGSPQDEYRFTKDMLNAKVGRVKLLQERSKIYG